MRRAPLVNSAKVGSAITRTGNPANVSRISRRRWWDTEGKASSINRTS